MSTPARLRGAARGARRARAGARRRRLRQQRRRQRPARRAAAAAARRSSRNPDNGKVELTIGSKNFTEQFILGEIYAQALEAAGYKVKTDLNLGSEPIALKALKDGEISGYPEYTSAPR